MPKKKTNPRKNEKPPERPAKRIQFDPDYGENCMKPDMDPEIFQLEKEAFLQNLDKTEDEKRKLERLTIDQADSGYWLEERRKLLTASNFYAICTRRESTPCANLIKKMLYTGSLSFVPAIKHGKDNEAQAILDLQNLENLIVEPNGLFIDKRFPYLGR